VHDGTGVVGGHVDGDNFYSHTGRDAGLAHGVVSPALQVVQVDSARVLRGRCDLGEVGNEVRGDVFGLRVTPAHQTTGYRHSAGVG